jgi:hypothetical protein
MLCYMDMTFCDYKDCRKFKMCSRAYTPSVLSRAEVWWGGDSPPIALYGDAPPCFEESKDGVQ